MAVKVLPALPAQVELIDKAVALGDRYTKTLGLLTPPAYRQAAENGGLLVAVDGDEVIGYALFGLPKRSAHIRLAHLCVAEEQRGRGIARLLVEAIKQRYPQRLGIKAKCRRDYELSDMWTSLGFVPNGEVRGRGRDGEILDGWWLDLGHPDLFTEVESDALLVVTVDHGVFADLRGLAETADAEESRALEAGWMTDLVELAYTPQLVHQIRDVGDTAERQHQRAALHGLRQLTPASEAVAERTAELLKAAVESLADLPVDATLRRCLHYVAETSCAGLQVLATRNPLLSRLADVAWEVARVRVVSPSTVTLHVDELRQAQVYRPADLMGTEFRSSEVAPGAEDELVAFFNQSGGDDGSAFAERLRSLTDDTVAWRRELLRDGQGHPVALYAWALDGRTLIVPVLRTADHPLEETLARQILFLLKRQGRDCGAETVRISDPYLPAVAKAAAGDDGFFEHDGKFVALLVDVCGTAAEVEAVAGGLARELTVEATALHAQMPAEVAAVVERAWWPAKVIDSELPSFLLPIKPRWSTELFNVPAMLLLRSHVLGISREHVYYRSSGRRGESVPARLLWYVSDGGAHMDGQMVVGSSRLDEVLIDTPDTLFSKFEHLGVYGRAEVQEAADASGHAMALRFSDTEIFPKPVTLRRLSSLARELGLPWSSNMLISLSKISNELFQAVYKEGHRKT
ncbi:MULTISPECIES: GNAT family N-acetyltransferase [Streptomyces]|uniref:GNAT family N-acetyltransferase n=1 Tax=Streptomyces TaxID=1883 RepID=UPI0029A91C71|nr:GNAT family N-acetyltransferase [Streptomyces europaeiscabiei]MDX3864576.1 GNAT family N-acetyltransferase [Streptomyces europaeiscabiei]MDX3871342.1 GNAT family N-acetyltransferase [Streptomyces europaeiscabiei]